MSMRSDGYTVIVWSDAEDPGSQFSSFNIALRLYDRNHNLIDEIAGPSNWVNQPDLEFPQSTQWFPAVSFDDFGNIVVVWTGESLPGCERLFNRIYARRFFWSGNPAEPVTPVADEFYVDSQQVLFGPDPLNAHPNVALTNTLDASRRGRFLVAWNAQTPVNPNNSDSEVHAQFFDGASRPLGREFRVHESDGPTGMNGERFRRLANAAQHTIAYGPDDQVLVTWTSFDADLGLTDAVYVDYLPPYFAESLCGQVQCLKGDVNTDGLVDGQDIQPFVTALLTGQIDVGMGTATACIPYEVVLDPDILCPYDITNDCLLTIEDVPPFVCLLLGEPVGCQTPPRPGGGDESQPDDGSAAMGGSGDPVNGDGGSGPSAGSQPGFRMTPELQANIDAFYEWWLANPRGVHPEMSDGEYGQWVFDKSIEFGLYNPMDECP